VIGGAFERGRLFPSLVFGFIWATVVYSPVACVSHFYSKPYHIASVLMKLQWTWNSNGWLFNLPSLDYAGGGPVHIASGFSALAYALVLGKRKEIGSAGQPRPHNVTMVFIGTTLIWFGWLCFNGGSTLNVTVRAMYAMFNTNSASSLLRYVRKTKLILPVAASTGMVGWVLTDYFRKGRKYSLVGSCSGVICGLVGITPCAGFVSVWYAAVIGFVTSVCCAWLDIFTDWINIDEGLDIFRLHGLGGIVGSFLTGVFADHTYSMLDGMTDASGSVNGNGIQIAYQLAGIAAISSYSFIVSAIILLAMKYIPGLSIRVDEITEIGGLDAYAFYMEEVGDWSAVQEENILGAPTMSHLGTPPMQKEEREENILGAPTMSHPGTPPMQKEEREENTLGAPTMNHLGTPPMQKEERVASKSA
jgi:Amt family ammonium transporter